MVGPSPTQKLANSPDVKVPDDLEVRTVPAPVRQSRLMAPSTALVAHKVATLCLQSFAELPTKGKPVGSEWTVLAGVVLVDSWEELEPQVVALGTGTKCLPASVARADASGLLIRDCHAEVCARRAFRSFLLAACRRALDGDSSAVEWWSAVDGGSEPRRTLRLQPRYEVFFYCSAPPCGAGSAVEEDWDLLCLCAPAGEALPAGPASPPVCRKPGRGETTRSVSCTDKLARWGALGLQGAALTHLLEPVRIDALVIGGPARVTALDAAINGRLRLVPQGASGTYTHHPIAVVAGCHALAGDEGATTRCASLLTTLNIAEEVSARAVIAKPTAIGINWSLGDSPGPWSSEGVNGLSGLRLGATRKGGISPKHVARTSKARFLGDFAAVLAAAHRLDGKPPPSASLTYREVKDRAVRYQEARSRFLHPSGPFAAWPTELGRAGPAPRDGADPSKGLDPGPLGSTGLFLDTG